LLLLTKITQRELQACCATWMLRGRKASSCIYLPSLSISVSFSLSSVSLSLSHSHDFRSAGDWGFRVHGKANHRRIGARCEQCGDNVSEQRAAVGVWCDVCVYVVLCCVVCVCVCVFQPSQRHTNNNNGARDNTTISKKNASARERKGVCFWLRIAVVEFDAKALPKGEQR